MLSKPDQAFIDRDHKLPGLRLLLDTEQLTTVIQANLPAETVIRVDPIYIRYKPGTNCLVAYHVHTSRRVLNVYARAFGDDASEKQEKLNRDDWKLRSDTSHSYAQPMINLEKEAVAVYFFPLDKKLKRIGKFDKASRRLRLLEKLFPDLCVSKEQLQFVQLRYKPERRHVVRVEINQRAFAVLKWYAPQGYEQAKASAQRFSSTERLHIPEILAWDDDNQILAFEWLGSTELTKLIEKGNAALTSVKETGQALAELHRQKINTNRLEPFDDLVDIRQTFESVIAICPQLQNLIDKIGASLSHYIKKLEPITTPIHGDFYSDQVLVRENHTVSFVDFDRAGLGDPARDLGNFIAHIERQVIAAKLSRTLADAICKTFIEGYQPSHQVRSRIDLYTALGLYRLLPEPFRHRQPNWDVLTQKILAATEHCLQRYISGIYNVLTNTPKEIVLLNDAALPCINLALNGRYMETKLEPLLRPHSQNAPLRVAQTHIIRHKPGRRCLLQYQITLTDDRGDPVHLCIMGKVRAKGADRKTYKLNSALWENGFGESSDDGLMVPQPIGLIPDLNMWLYHKVEASSVGESLDSNDNHTQSRIATLIHKLHHCGQTPRKTHNISDELAILRSRMDTLCKDFPHWAERINRLFCACQELAQNIPDSIPRCIHRDFYFDQVLVSAKKQLALIDLDLCSQGDPALDLGNYIAHLMEYALRIRGDINALSSACLAFERAYVQLSPLPKETIDAYVSLSLARLVQISTLLPERRAFTEQLLMHTEQRLGISANTNCGRLIINTGRTL
ncbi:MAG: aminoglycoside phosphotransferase family protein [Gammaproteobacteria bacterium]|nr:aminoglycoside phosphotransferase family protein [Gammaproteobacteria bacterium]MDH5799511.1 aminoglycoside phosphotransferase family protein [Gammaproteobacteria bacterium]